MFRLLKVLALTVGLALPAAAQWGTVTAQSDTNRFISSQQTYGLVMPHQSIVVGKLDTTISSAGTNGGGGYKVITGSLLNWDDNCVGGNRWLGRWDCSGSYEAWREKEKSTSWYQAARGDTTKRFPTNYLIKAQVGQDSTTIFNRDTGELWMAHVSGGTNMLLATVTDIAFRDGWFYTAHGGAGQAYSNFLSEEAWLIQSSTRYKYNGNIQQRNDALAHTDMGTTGGVIASNTVNAITVVRDPFGLTDENGAPKHWWVAGLSTNTSISIYNPHANAIYDGPATSGDQIDISMNKRGELWGSYNNSGSEDSMQRWGMGTNSSSIFGFSSDGAGSRQITWAPTGSGAADLAWSSTPLSTKVLSTNDGQSIVGGNSSRAFFYNSEGVYVMHPTNNSLQGTDGSAKQRFSSTVNAPVEFGNAAISVAFEDLTTDSSPYGNTLTATNGGTVAAVFGNGYSGCIGCYLTHTGSAEFAPAAYAGQVWFKVSQTGLTQTLWNAYDNGATQSMHVYIDSDNTLDASVVGASATNTVDTSVSVSDGLWHHAVLTNDGNGGNLRLYLDGQLIGSTAISYGSLGGIDAVRIGAHKTNANYTIGILDDFSFTANPSAGDPMPAGVVSRVYDEGSKQLKRGGSPINRDHLHAADVDYVDALDNGIWLAGNEDSLTVFDGRLALQTYGTSLGAAGTIKDAKLVQNAGTDSVGVIIVTATETILIQPDVNLEKMASSSLYHKEPILIGETVVVDSSGGGHFWTINDAVASGANAGHPNVFVQHGTYGPATISQQGIRLRCAGKRSSVSGSGLHGVVISTIATADALTISGYDIDVGGCGFYSGVGGIGGGYDAVLISGTYVNFHDNLIVQCDDDGIVNNGAWNTIAFNDVTNCDDVGILSTDAGDFSRYIGNSISAVGNDAQTVSGGDRTTWTANVWDESLVDGAIGTTTAANAEY